MINFGLFRPWNVAVIGAVALITMFLMSAAKNRLDNRVSRGG